MDNEHLIKKFKHFADQGVIEELSRMYYSVNARNPQKIYTELLQFLINNPDFNLCSIQSKITGIAAKKECAAEKRWMFDFDTDDPAKVIEFNTDILKYANMTDKHPLDIDNRKTPHGYAILTNRGFDTRPLFEKWDKNTVSLKRDDMLCCKWLIKFN